MQTLIIHKGRQIAFSGRAVTGGIPLVLLHGFCEDSSVWDGIMPGLDEIPTIRIDLPGFGASDLPAAPGMGAYADAVLAVLNERQIDRAVLLGHSMGGYTVLDFAARFPERLAGWGLLHAHPYADTPDRIENRRRGIVMLEEGKKDLFVAQLFPGLFTPEFGRVHPELLETLIARGRLQPAKGIIAALQGMIERTDRIETLNDATSPVLLMFGESDQLVPVEWVPDLIRRAAVTDATLLPGVAHMAMFEAPEITVQTLLRFYQFCRKGI